jgi:AcrR family transcriptional regulator
MPMARENKRDHIVYAAIELLATVGPEGLSAATLAAAAGVSKANVFHHFRTIDDVVLEAFELFLLGMQAFSPEPGKSLRDWLLALGAETAQLLDDQQQQAGAYFAFAVRARTDPRLQARLAETVTEAEAGFAAIIEALTTGLSDAEIRALAGLLMIAGDGLAIHRHLFPERAAEQQAAWRALVDRIAPQERTAT